uniref:WD_REPEATS_REGION domain-containing protein n=1 Tax=Mesocestoides corti TaxID=53468 RepID=A0A5K3EHD5_MESCO
MMNSTQLTGLDALQQKQIGGAGPDARRMRKAIFRRTIDYNASVINYLKERVWKRSPRSRLALQPDYLYNYLMNPPSDYLDNPMNCVTGKLVRTSTNKNKCPIYCVCWTPEGRRLITGAFSGEFTLWNGLTFNFETILQAHEAQIRCMKWSHNDEWLLTADHAGYVKYWQANMNNVQMYQAHKMPIRGVRYALPTADFVSLFLETFFPNFSLDSQILTLSYYNATRNFVLFKLSLLPTGERIKLFPFATWVALVGWFIGV